MEQKKRNIVYLITIGVLVLASLGILRIGEKNSISYDPRKFTLEENTVITTVVIDDGEGINKLEYTENQWFVNDKYTLDQGMRDVFFAVISQVEILRPVSDALNDSISDEINEKGLAVEVLNNSDVVLSYKVLGDTRTQKTYFLDTKEMRSYQVHLPGYKSYIAGIYEVEEKDWRDRFVWDVNWTSMKSLKIDYSDPEMEDLNFTYNNDFVGIDGLNELDTGKMLSYLENIAYLQASEFISENETVISKIEITKPDITLSLAEIGDRNIEILLFNADNYGWIGRINGTEFAIFEEQEIERLMRGPKDFLPE